MFHPLKLVGLLGIIRHAKGCNDKISELINTLNQTRK